jgi:hypothetical protein
MILESIGLKLDLNGRAWRALTIHTQPYYRGNQMEMEEKIEGWYHKFDGPSIARVVVVVEPRLKCGYTK